MALVLQDRVKETTTTTGTGTFTLDGTSTGFVGFGVIGNGNETYYTAVDNTTGEWEVGIGTYNAGTLTRDTVLASSNSGNKVPFVAGSKDVFVAYPAEKAVTLDTAQTLANKTLSNANLGTPTAGVLTNATGLPLSTGVTGTLPVGNGGTGATTLTGYVKASGTSAFTAVAAIPGADVSGNISGNAANVTGVVAIANGGTAVTSAPANGQVLIGNGTGYTLATLTAGTGVTITNAPGSITINAPEVGTVTAVTATAPLASSGGNTPDISLTGTVGVANGGTGATTLTGYVKASGTAAFTAVAQIPNTDISGLGTMSTQNANNVAITGGAIDGTTVGLSTPSSGAFTTLTASGASITSINSGVALLTTATITNLTATSASIASANVGTAVVTTGSVGNLTVTGASIASANVGVALVTTGTVNNLTATGASVASANLGVAVITTGTVGNLTATSASVASANAAVALITTGTVTNLTATSASIASANVATAVVTGLTVTNASIASANAGTATITTGNLAFSGTAQRITGDFSGTNAARLYFQSSTTNGATSLSAMPNGTGTQTGWFLYAESDLTNNSFAAIRALSGTEMRLQSGISGTGTYLPMTFYTGGSERMRLDTSGNLSLGSGNLTFSSTGQRITGDFSNATWSSRVSFQTSTTNGNTNIPLIPNGTGTNSFFTFFNNSNPTNAGALSVGIVGSTDARINSSITGTGTYLPMTFYTGGSERMRIDTSGNVGIGTASLVAGYRLNVVVDSGNAQQLIRAGTNFNSTIAFGDQDSSTSGQLIYAHNGDYMAFNTNAAERMRIDSSGNVGIGTSSPTDKLHVAGGSGSTIRNTASAGSSWFVGSNVDSYILHNESNTPMLLTTNATERMRITAGGEVYIAGTTDQGAYNLQCNGTGVWGAGAYVNGSDERLKDDITTLNDGLNVISQLRPVTFKYKPDYSKDQNVQTGFIAQELQTALEGKDYLDGVVQAGPSHLNVAYQSLIPILVKAIQELSARVAELEAK